MKESQGTHKHNNCWPFKSFHHWDFRTYKGFLGLGKYPWEEIHSTRETYKPSTSASLLLSYPCTICMSIPYWTNLLLSITTYTIHNMDMKTTHGLYGLLPYCADLQLSHRSSLPSFLRLFSHETMPYLMLNELMSLLNSFGIPSKN